MSTLEIAAFFLNLLGVWLTAKQYRWCWPINILAVACYIQLFYEVKLYSDALLQCIFILLQVYGWYSWSTKQLKQPTSVSHLPRSILLYSTVVGLLLGGALGFITHHYTDASLPWLDAMLMAFSVVASIWAAKKYIESWLLWCVLDMVYVLMYLSKALYPTALLYLIFILLAINGWRLWSLQRSAIPSS